MSKCIILRDTDGLLERLKAAVARLRPKRKAHITVSSLIRELLNQGLKALGIEDVPPPPPENPSI